MPTPSQYVWSGEHSFEVIGTNCRDDTLWIEANGQVQGVEQPLRLTLPTLCITYADLRFANASGGRQDDYPASVAYGPAHFDPPVEIKGEQQIEKLTWIRGAERVVIGPAQTLIEWYIKKPLVIPRLRIARARPATAVLALTNVPIPVAEPLQIDVIHCADGRSIGGVRIEKRHPKWTPGLEPKTYDLWIRLLDGCTGKPMPEVPLKLLRWNKTLKTPFGIGVMQLADQVYTNGTGSIHSPDRPSGELEAVTAQLSGWRVTARSFRALPGQPVHFHLFAWPLRTTSVRFTWPHQVALGDLALLAGHSPEFVLKANHLHDASDLRPGMQINFPCYAGTYRLEAGDKPEWLAQRFGYTDAGELAKLNAVASPAALRDIPEIELPGWHYFYARTNDTLEQVDQLFGLPSGWSRTVGRAYHPEPRLPFESEVIAVPTQGFVATHLPAQLGP